MYAQAACVNALHLAASLPDAVRFETDATRAGEIQERVLKRILQRNADTEFGRRHGFRTIRSVAEYRERIPSLGWDAFAPYVREIAAGRPNVLTAEPVTLFEPTSGSSSGTKLIPYTASLSREFRRAINPWITDLYTRIPGLVTGRSYWSVSPVTGGREHTTGGIPVGFEDDSEYLGVLGRALSAVFAVPGSVKFSSSMDDFRYVTAGYLLAAEDLSLVSVWNPSFLLLILDAVRLRADELLRELSGGRFGGRNHVRARELSKVFSRDGFSRFDHAWSRLRLISCWADASAGSDAARLSAFFPGVLLQGKGLLATEGVTSFPLLPSPDGKRPGGCVPAYRSHYLEFAEPGVDGRTRGVTELEPGETCFVLLTTSGGLYRYRTGDAVTVTGRRGALPLLRFEGREKTVDLRGEKIDELFISRLLDELRAEAGRDWSFMAAPETGENAGAPFYALFAGRRAEVSGPGAEQYDRTAGALRLLEAGFEEGLRRNFHYRYARSLGQLSSSRVFRVDGSLEEAYLRCRSADGMRLGNVKLPSLETRTGWSARLPGSFIG